MIQSGEEALVSGAVGVLAAEGQRLKETKEKSTEQTSWILTVGK